MKNHFLQEILTSILIFLVLTASFSIFISNAKGSSDTATLSVSDNIKKLVDNNSQLTEHKINSIELQQIKNLAGVYIEGQNYNQIISGHGSGLRPPSETEWNTIGNNLYIVDDITGLSNNLAASSSVDESTKPWFPPIGDQGSQASCVTWSVGYYTKTFQEVHEHNWNVSSASWLGGSSGYPTPSYQNKISSPAFIYNLINGGVDSGSSYYDAMQIVCSVGDCSWQKMPYKANDYTTWPSEQAWTEAPIYRSDSNGFQYMYVTTDSALSNLKNWIASDHLATIAIDDNQYVNLTSSDLLTADK